MTRTETAEEITLAAAYKTAHAKFTRASNSNATTEVLNAAKLAMTAAWDAYSAARNAAIRVSKAA